MRRNDTDPSASPGRPRGPRLRRELEVTIREAAEGVEVIVGDPATGQYFRGGALEAALLARLDGETPVEAVAAQMETEFPALPAAEVVAFVGAIEGLGFLAGGETVAPPRPPLYRRLLYAQVRVANPDRFFDHLLPWVGWLYRPAGWAAVALLFLAAGTVAVLSRAEIVHQLSRGGDLAFWITLWAGAELSGTLHEFGHGLTCKWFGGRTSGIGYLWMYGIPCLYCDVSGAWTLPRKSQRLWVTGAGLYCQFVAGAVALLLWRLLEPGGLASDLLLAVAASCGIYSLFNLNPLLKLDGYFLLSDWLEIPNLRPRAFETLGQRLARFWFGEEHERTADDRILLAYAVGAALLFLGAGVAIGTPVVRSLAALAARLVHWRAIPMIGRRRLLLAGGGLGLLVATLVLMPWELRLASPCTLEAATRAAVRARVEGRVAELWTQEGARVRRGETLGSLATFERWQQLAERQAQREIVLGEIAALTDRLPIVAAEAARGTAVAATGAHEARRHVQEEEETLPARVAAAGRRVEAARAEGEAATSRLLEARAAVEAQSRVAIRLRGDADRAARGEAPPALAAVWELWQQRRVEQDMAQRNHERIRLLAADGAVALQQVDLARGQHEAAARRAGEALQAYTAADKTQREAADDAEAELARRRAALAAAVAAQAAARANAAATREVERLVVAGSRPSRLETARLRAHSSEATLAAARTARRELLARRAQLRGKRHEVRRLTAQIATLRDQIRRSALVAPCDGVVTTPRVGERIGTHLEEGDAVLDVEDPSILFTRIFLNEKEVAEVRPGQRVALRLAAFPKRLFAGRVSEIAPRAVPGGSEAFPTKIVEVRLRVGNPEGRLRPGMSGWAKIDAGRRPLGAILLRRASRYLRTEVWSWF